MKKYIKYVLILLVGVLLLPISVHAEGNLVVNMYEKEKWDDFSELEYNAFEYLQYVKGYFHWTIDYGEEDTYYLYDEDENLVFSYVYDYNEDSPFQINHDYYILENNIEYIFTDDDSLDPTLEDYDGIELIFEKDRDNEIYLSKIKEETRTPGTIINGKPKINKLNIDVDVKFSDVTDYILYKTIIKNNTETDYVIDNTTKFGDSEYIKYDFEFENDNNVILAGEEKVMYVRITYNKEIPATILASGNYTETRALQVELMTEVGDTTNPPTGDNIINILIMLGASIILLIVMIKYKKARTIMIFVISGLILIPTIATAEEKINITINAKIEVAGMKKFCYRTYGLRRRNINRYIL